MSLFIYSINILQQKITIPLHSIISMYTQVFLPWVDSIYNRQLATFTLPEKAGFFLSHTLLMTSKMHQFSASLEGNMEASDDAKMVTTLYILLWSVFQTQHQLNDF